MRDDDEFYSHLLEIVFEHYGVAYPSGYGERSSRCPCHDDAHASASVNTIKGLFNCHACGAAGDGFNVVMANERMSFPDACGYIERVLDVSLEEIRGISEWEPRRGVSGKSGNKPGSRQYRPSWLRGNP